MQFARARIRHGKAREMNPIFPVHLRCTHPLEVWIDSILANPFSLEKKATIFIAEIMIQLQSARKKKETAGKFHPSSISKFEI